VTERRGSDSVNYSETNLIEVDDVQPSARSWVDTNTDGQVMTSGYPVPRYAAALCL